MTRNCYIGLRRIQDPDRDGHIVRLGTQYSLAGTQTSCVAINDTPAKASDSQARNGLDRELFFTEDLVDTGINTTYQADSGGGFEYSDDDMGFAMFGGESLSGDGGGRSYYRKPSFLQPADTKDDAVEESDEWVKESDDDMGHLFDDDDSPPIHSAPIPAPSAAAPSPPPPPKELC